MATERYLIVNADDFGQSPGVNRGIVAAHQGGIVTSASMMVRWPAAAEAAAYGRNDPEFSLGLHLDLGEWAFRDGAWVPVYEVVPADDPDAVAREIEDQLAEFRRLVGRDPTHFDSHQHVHRSEPVRSILIGLGQKLGVPVRHYTPVIAYCGQFYGQTAKGEPYPDGISIDGLLRTLAELPAGVTELGCHPGAGDDIDSMYCGERSREVETLCHPRVRTALDELEIELRSFHTAPEGRRCTAS